MEASLQKIEEIFGENGILSRIFPGYRRREQQIELARQMLRSLYAEKHLFAEAGTGTGKSFAYLIAASLWALENGGTVLVSTHTLPLQSQLIEKDLPVVAQVMEQLGYEELRYELAKGRSHYICKRRLENLVQEILKGDHPRRELVEKIAIYSQDAKTGTRNDFPFAIPNDIWEKICGDSDDCFHHHSPFYERCFIQNARRKWARAHIVVANHALVFADLALKMNKESGVLPKYDRLVFDEGHRVEEVFSRFFERSVSLPEMENLFRVIRQRKQGWMRTVLDEDVLQEIDQYYRQIREKLQDVFGQVAEELRRKQERQGISVLQPVMELIEAPVSFRQDVKEPVEALAGYLEGIGQIRCSEEPEQRGMAHLIGRIRALYENVRFILHCEGGDDWAHWMEKVPPPNAGILDPQADWLRLVAQPIQARTVLQDLFQRVPVTFVSATMATNQNFSFLSSRLGVEEYDQFIADSPFDYASRALLVVSETSPDPRDGEAFESFLTEGLKRILRITRGRTLVLFTSYASLERVGKSLEGWAAEENLELLLQLPNSDREKLIAAFKAGNNRILFGCDSFWEGIDIPGDALSCVVITKLPFANPQEPLVKAKINILEKQGKNSFAEYMVPTAILKLKQGFGRLIRTAEDRGAVVIMDSRVVKKGYGQRILSSLPPARRGKIGEIRRYMPEEEPKPAHGIPRNE